MRVACVFYVSFVILNGSKWEGLAYLTQTKTEKTEKMGEKLRKMTGKNREERKQNG